MRAVSALATGILLAAVARATALTSLLLANQRACFYADVDGIGEKIGAFPRPCAEDGQTMDVAKAA